MAFSAILLLACPGHYHPLAVLDFYKLMGLQLALPNLRQAAIDLARKVLVGEDAEVFHEVLAVASVHDNDVRLRVLAREEDGAG